MELTVNQILCKGVAAHKEGKIKEAESLYRSILETQPKHPDANHNLGIVLVSLNKSASALTLFKTAIEANPNIEQFWINYTNALINEKRFNEAEVNFRNATNSNPNFAIIQNNLSTMLYSLGRLQESEISARKAIMLKPDFVEAYNNLGTTLNDLGKLDEAKASYKKAIELKPNYAEAYYNLGITLYNLNKKDEAETSYKKAIELKPNYAEAYNNLGTTLNDLGKLDEAKASYRKAIELKPNYTEAFSNLEVILNQKKLLLCISQENDINKKNKVNQRNIIKSEFSKRVDSNLFILNRAVETQLLTEIYKINTKKLDDVDPTYLRYGNGRSSDYQLFQNNSPIIKKVAKDLRNIMKQAVNSDIFIIESFFNIFQAGSGIISHTHLNRFDKACELTNQKFSLTYYLSIGDQNCNKPGILKLYNPSKEILPTKGTIAIFSAGRKHSAEYNGKTDRVMIGVNFYSHL